MRRQPAILAAIRRSISHNEIVTVEYNGYQQRSLAARCDGSVDAVRSFGVYEYWGTHQGNDWRVHMRGRRQS